MRSMKDNLIEDKSETSPVESDNLIKNEKYCRKLELQRMILNRLIDSEVTKTLEQSSNTLFELTNQKPKTNKTQL
jgi:hypothetical protein